MPLYVTKVVLDMFANVGLDDIRLYGIGLRIHPLILQPVLVTTSDSEVVQSIFGWYNGNN